MSSFRRRSCIVRLLALVAIIRTATAANPTAPTNLVAWCLVPFDTQKRGSEERAALLERLGFCQFAYDWRSEHIPSFDAEIVALAKHHVHLRAWWFPATLNDDAKAILACLRRHSLHPELWVMMGDPAGADTAAKVEAAAQSLRPVVQAANEIGSVVGLYNHGGWFGEPEHQLAIRSRLASLGHTNVGLVYNLHHGHDHLDRFPELLQLMQPHLLSINLNGMVRDGEKVGRKIIPFGSGEYDAPILRVIRESGYGGPIGILGHTQEDVEVKLKQDLAGLHRVEAALDRGMPTPWPAPSPKPSEPVDAKIARTASEPSGRALDPAATLLLQGSSKSRVKAAASLEAGAHPGAGPESISQGEADWVDNRWQQTDVGPSLASSLRLPNGSVIAKALTIKVGDHDEGAVAYDLATGELRAAWLGGFVKFDPARFGLIGMPRPDGSPFFTQASVTNSNKTQDYKWRGLRLAGRHILLEYELEGQLIRELPQLSFADGHPLITRSLAWVSADGNRSWQKLSPHFPAQNGVLTRRATPDVLLALLEPATSRWAILTTQGKRGADTDAFAVDTLTMPYANPWKALLFASGVDLAPDGSAYVCTIHGDVWHVTGIDDSLTELKWQRYATGLFQPLGLKVRDGFVYVLGRDRITRLHGNHSVGIADYYENFYDGIETSTSGHDYVTCLEQDLAGHFYYVDPKGVHRVSSDGKSAELLASGFRNPNGLGVSPDGRVLTVAPQQGNWTPSSGIWEIPSDAPGEWGGYGGPRVTAARPLGYDSPLCWIPHAVDNSSGSQVWVPPGVWGPLGGQILHLLWGRCGLMLILRDTQDGQRNGAVVPLPVKFLSGPNRGSFHQDALFVAGSTGWQTSAAQDGALQRVRWTGKRWQQPVAWRVRSDGVEFTFPEPLQREAAEDVGSYSVKRWNYRYAAEYGSKDWSARKPDHEGRDDVPVLAGRLSPDGKTVYFALGQVEPVMQLEVKYHLDASDGHSVQGSFWGTVNPKPISR